MAQSINSFRFAAAGAVVILFAGAHVADAQIVRAELTDGFARTSSIAMSVDEMLGVKKDRSVDEPIVGPGYPSLWIDEVQFKPVRLMRLELPDPKTGELRKELVRYMVWRAIRRDYTELAGDGQADLEKKLADPETDPSNVLDPETLMPLQMPRFLLETLGSEDTDGNGILDPGEDRDGDGQLDLQPDSVEHSYFDEISVEIQNAVFRREMGRRGQDLKLLNSIEAISEIGDPVAVNDPDALSKAVYGVAVWRNVDPKADFFSVTMSGFCNAYRISGPAAARVIEEKVVVQKFARPGDEFLQEEMEFRLVDDADTDGDGKPDTRYPIWKYRPRRTQLSVSDLDAVLRNVRQEPAPAVEN